MGRQRQLEQARPVERGQAEEEQAAATTGLASARMARECTTWSSTSRGPHVLSGPGQGPQRQGHRGARHEEQRHEHRDGHVHDHVHAEQHPAPDPRRPAGGPHEQHPAQHPADRAPHRPRVAAPAQPHDAGEVEPHREHGRAEEEPVDPPRGEPVAAGHRPRVGEAGQLEDAARGRAGVGHRRHAAGQHRREPGRRAHDDELPDGEPGEGPPVGRLVRRAGSARLRRCSQPRTPQRDERDGLERDDEAVCRGQPVQRTEPDPCLLHAGEVTGAKHQAATVE